MESWPGVKTWVIRGVGWVSSCDTVYKIKCLNFKYSIAENSKGQFILAEHLIFVSILRIHLGKCEKMNLHIDEPPYFWYDIKVICEWSHILHMCFCWKCVTMCFLMLFNKLNYWVKHKQKYYSTKFPLNTEKKVFKFYLQ